MLSPRGKGRGSRAPKSNRPVGKQIGPKKKGSRSMRLFVRVKKDVKKHPGKHTRPYVWNAKSKLITVPGPSPLQRAVPTLGYRRLPTGVFHTFVDFPETEPVIQQTEATDAEILANFPVVSK